MNFKVGVFAEGQISGEAIKEAKRALQVIAMKYKCQFELTKNDEKIEKKFKAKSKFKKGTNEKGDSFLSFGGELEL